MSYATLIVIAKAPRPGYSKTRLCPPCTPAEAAQLADAALRDTLAAVSATPAARRVLALDGDPGPWLAPGFEVIAQRAGCFAERLAGVFADAGGPAFLVAMDTPQVTPDLLEVALDRLDDAGAALGPTPDGGYWGIGLREADDEVFSGVPMSSAGTFDAQHARLCSLGLSPARLAALEDVDTIESARRVARTAPVTRFARLLAASGHAPDDHEPVAEAAA